MRELDRGMAMQSAIVALEYIAEPVPAAPSRYIMALRAVNMATQAASLGGGSGGSRPKGTISDPTGTAAIRGIGDTTELTDGHAIVLETAWCIRGDVTSALYDARLTHPAPSTAAAALDHLRWAATAPHTTTNAVAAWRQAGRFEDAAMLDTSIDLVCREACNLAVMVRAASAKVARAPKDIPKQRPLIGCTSCKRDGGAWEPVYDKAESSELCRWCYDYRATYGQRPPVELVRMHRQGRRISTLDIARATGG
jgi:hypothetical protein